MKAYQVFTKGLTITMLTCILAVIHTLTDTSVVNGQSISLAVSASPQQNHRIYLPLVIKSVPEVDIPPCRWPHNVGTYTGISYKWGNRLQTPGTLWRIAFESAISDWSGAPTKLYFYYSSSGTTIFNTYSMQDGRGGYASIACSGSTTTGVSVFGNVYYDPGNNNIRHAYAGHETGHAQSIGHIACCEIALMGNNPDPNIYFTPQQIDIALVNQIYR